MNRDTFWENAKEIIFLFLKIIISLLVLQLLLIISGSEMKLPFIHAKMMEVFYWWKKNFSGTQIGF